MLRLIEILFDHSLFYIILSVFDQIKYWFEKGINLKNRKVKEYIVLKSDYRWYFVLWTSIRWKFRFRLFLL
jgi:hypothetical protein